MASETSPPEPDDGLARCTLVKGPDSKGTHGMSLWRVIGFSTLAAAIVGCATTHGNLSSSAERLERSSYALARDTRGPDFGGSGYESDARRLADESHDFRRVLLDRRADERDVESAFNDVSRSYHALRDEVDRSDSQRARANLKPVTEAYLDVEREMGGYGERQRRASRDDYERERRDRY